MKLRRTLRPAAGAAVIGWVWALAVLPAGGALAQDMGRGAAVYELCTQCHGAQGQGNRAALVPSIAGLSDWYVVQQLEKWQQGHRANHPDDIAGLRMRPMSRAIKEEGDNEAVAAYVAALPMATPAPELTGGDPKRGEQLYAPCVACHDTNGLGKKELNAPSLLHTPDWYLLTQLSNYKAGIRGNSPQDPNGMLMRSMSMTLPDDQAVQDVIAYIQTLR